MRFHIENQDILWDKRLKGGFFRHTRYFGPRGELIFYSLALITAYRLIRNNLNRENNIDSLLNDRNVYYPVSLPYEMRKIE